MAEFFAPVPPQQVDEFGKPIPVLSEANVVETDYRLFRYSKFSLPFLIFLLLLSATLLMLTFWQGGFGNVKFIRSGIPRDLEPWRNDDDGDGGLPRGRRNLRFALSIIAIVPVALVALVYYANPRPKLQRVAYFVAAFILLVAFVLGIIAFAIDVGDFNDARQCMTDVITRRLTCESRGAYGATVTALDIILAIFALISAVMLILFSRDDTFKHKHVAWTDQQYNLTDDPHFVEELELKPVIPGRDTVHKALVFLGLLATLITAILLLFFTIYIHEFRERVTGPQWDPINRQMQSGWAKENTRLRLAVAGTTCLLCLLSFVPYPHRVYAYVLGYLFFLAGIAHFVIFGLDVSDLIDAKDMECPNTGVECVYHPYNATTAFDFINGLMVLVYVLYEFCAKNSKSTVTVHRDLPAAPLEEFLPASGYPNADWSPVNPDGTPALAAPPLRPLLGVEVIEIEHPVTNELNVSVLNVTPGSASEAAGLRVGDIISRWDEIPIRSKADFAQAVNSAPIGSQVVLQVLRQGHGLTTTSAVEYLKLAVRGVPV